MKIKKQFVLASVIGAVLLAACGKKNEQTPTEQVQAEKIDLNWESEQTEYEGFTEEEIAEKAVSLEVLFSGYDAVLRDAYENFHLPDTVTISPTAIYKQVEIVQESGFTENAEEILRLFFDDELSGSLKFSDYSEIMDQATLIIDSDEEKVYCVVNDSGFVSVIKPSGYEIGYGDFEVVDIVHVDRGEPLSQSYALRDGEESIQEAVSYIEEWMNQNWIIWEPDFAYCVKTVEVRQYGDSYIYDFYVEKLLEGIPLDDSFGETGLALVHGYIESKYIGSTIHIWMCNRNSIDIFSNQTGILKIQSVETEEDGWLSLSDCVHMLEQFFSEYAVYDISDIEMQYVLCPDYDSVRGLESYSFSSPGLRVLAKPVWCFVMDIPEEKLLNEDGSFTAGYQKHYIDVDMRTGEVWLELE